jgi:hypothetical protein
MPRAAAELTHVEQLDRLRRRCAKTENVETLRHVLSDTGELASVAPELLLGDIADFTDRIYAKLDRLGIAAPKAVRNRKRPVQIVDVTESADDEHPITVKKDRLLAKLRSIHGEQRADIPHELERASPP